MTRVCRSLTITLGIALIAQALSAQVPKQPYNNRRAKATATIAGSRGLYDGTFTASNIANICGDVPADRNFSGLASFIIEYPYEARATDEIQSISFGSSKIAGKVTTASVFMLNVSVLAKNGGRPYAYVLNPGTINGETGTASVVRNKDKSVTLTIKGKNAAGETIQMTVTCT